MLVFTGELIIHTDFIFKLLIPLGISPNSYTTVAPWTTLIKTARNRFRVGEVGLKFEHFKCTSLTKYFILLPDLPHHILYPQDHTLQ